MGSSPPDPPDYAAAARETAAGDLEAARLTTVANRPNIYTPEGSTIWQQGVGGDPDRWTATQTLTPEGQAAFESYQRLQTALGGLGEQAAASVGNLFGTTYTTPGVMPGYQGPTGSMPGYQGPQGPMPSYYGPQGSMPVYQGAQGAMPVWGGPQGNVPMYQAPGSATPLYQGIGGEMPTYGEHRDEVRSAMMERVNTDIERDRETLSSQLIASGHQKGSEGYNREMEQLNRKQTDARQQAEIAAEQMAGQAYSSALQGRSMQNREAMDVFNTAMQSSGMDMQKAQAQFINDMQSRGMTAQEATQAFNTAMQGRQMANQEGAMMFDSLMQTRGMSAQEAQQLFQNQMQARGMASDEAQNLFNSLMQTRQLQSQEAMADWTTGMDAYRQAITNALLERQTPLNEISAFRTGSQVNIPQFQSYGQQQYTGGADLLGAAGMQGQADLAAYNAQQAPWNALIGAAGTIGGGYAGTLSDVRLKRDITHISNLPSGIPVYSFKYIWSDDVEVGVMAQEVLPVIPEAVIRMPNGYYAVDYRKIH